MSREQSTRATCSNVREMGNGEGDLTFSLTLVLVQLLRESGLSLFCVSGSS